MATKKCPDRRREGKGHNWITMGVNKGTTFDVRLAPPLYRVCNFCEEEDRETVLCEGQAREQGRWPRWHTCGKVAAFTSEFDWRAEKDGVVHNYCKTHHPETAKEKQKERDEVAHTKYMAEIRSKRIGWYGTETLMLLREFENWASANADLLEADEWLKLLAKKLAAHAIKLDKGQ